MKVIFQEFGTAIIAMITVILIIGMLFGLSVSGKYGILEITGSKVNKTEVDYTEYRDFDSVVTWHNRMKPVAAYTSTYGRFYAMKSANLLERYYATDMEGNIYFMDEVILTQLFSPYMFGIILDIRVVDETSVMSAYSVINGNICFPSAGVYAVYIKIRDRENLTSIWKIPIAVDERRN